jgi:hypothetical protein
LRRDLPFNPTNFPELAALTALALLTWVLLLLTRLLPAALLLARLTWALARILVLLARVLVLLAHSGSPLLKSVGINARSSEWLREEDRAPPGLRNSFVGCLLLRRGNRKRAAKTVICAPFLRR